MSGSVVRERFSGIPSRSPTRRFLRHFAEMLVAMLLGMAVLGGAFSGILSLAGTSYSDTQRDVPALVSLVMAVNMTAPMAAWTRHRGHAWARVAEMSGAMFLPALALIALLPAGVVDGRSLIDIQHGVMVPAMLAVMLLRRSYYS